MTAIDEKALGAAIIEGSNMAGERLVTQIVTAYLKALEDEGLVLVPKEPTEAMAIAGLREGDALGELIDWRGPDSATREDIRRVYSTMLAAAVG